MAEEEILFPSERAAREPAAKPDAAKPAEAEIMFPSERAAAAEAKEAARPSANPIVAGWEATKEAAGGVKEGFSPSKVRPVDISPLSWFGRGLPEQEGETGLAKIGRGLLSAAGLPLAPFVGAGKSVIANVTAPALRATEYGIKKGVQQVKPDYNPAIPSHQEAYESLLPGAEAAISAVGPAVGPRGAIIPKVPALKAPSGGLLTKGGQEVTAGKMLEKAATDPDAAIGALDASKEIVPGSRPTTFQATGDLGLGQLERVVQNTPEGQAAFQQRWAEQNNARTNALRGVQQGGDASTVPTHLRTAMEADDALAVLEEQRAIARADQRAAELGDNVPPEIQGQIYRTELDAAHGAIRSEERRAWEGVDPNNQLFVNTDPVSNTQFRIYGEITPEAAAGLTAGERTISGIVSQYPNSIPFKNMRDLRSLVSSEMRKELYANGPSPAYARLTQLRGAIQESVNNPVSAGTGALAPDAAARLAEATDITKRRAEIFKQGPVEDVLKREGAAGPFNVTNAAVPGRFIPSGPKGYDHVNAYLRAVGNERGIPDVYDALVSDMRSKATSRDGRIDPNRLMTWARTKQDALRAVSERDGGQLVQRLVNVEGAEDAIATVAAQRNQLAKLHNEGIFGKLIGVDNPNDVQNILGAVFGKQTSVTDAQAIMSRLRASPEAQMGARQAIVDWIWDRFISNTAAGTTDENIIRADQFQQFIKLKEQTLRAFGFTPDQISTWQMISDDMRQTKMSIDATKMRGGPGTAQDLNAMYQMREDQGQSLFRKIAFRLMAGSVGWAAEGPLGGAAAMFGAGVVSSMRDRGIKSVQALVKDAMMNPAIARRLLVRARGKEVMPGMKKWMGYEAAAQQQGQPQQPTPQGYKHGGTVRPLGREGIKARNKARAVEARERSSLARRSAQAKRKVKYQGGGEIASGGDNTPLTGPNELFEGQHDKTARGRAAAGEGGRAYESAKGDFLRPDARTRYPIRNIPIQRQGISAPEPAVEPGIYADGGAVPYATDSPEFKEEVARALAKNPDTIAAAQEFYPRVPLNDKAWGQFIENAPASINIEDRRGLRGAWRKADGGGVNADSGNEYNTDIGDDEAGFQAWKAQNAPKDSGQDYDLRGAYKAGVTPDPVTGHMPDTFKKPNHPTFSNQSQYATGENAAKAGSWEGDTFIPPDQAGGFEAAAARTRRRAPVREPDPISLAASQGKGAGRGDFAKAAGEGTLDLLKTPGRVYKEGMTEADVDFGPSMAMQMLGASTPFMNRPGIGVFGGRGAKTANLAKLAEAEQMLKEGVPHATIRNRTGWEFGSEGKPKFEISDADARIIAEHPEDRIYEADSASRVTGFRPNQRLEQILHHPALYEAYPWLKDMRTSLDVSERTKPGASYAPPTKYSLRGHPGEVEVAAPTYERGGVGDLFEKQPASDVGARDLLLHEVQHAIQNREGFAPGANPRQLPIKPSEITSIAQSMARRNGIDWDAASPTDKTQMERVVRHRIYKAQAGEAEARNVQTRADSTLPSRPSWETEDIKRQNQMIDKGRKLKPGEKPFEDAKIYKLERDEGTELPVKEPVPGSKEWRDAPNPNAPFPQYAENYPPVGPPKIKPKTDFKTGKPVYGPDGKQLTFEAKQQTPDAEAFMKERARIIKDMDENGYHPYFDENQRFDADPKNYPLNTDTINIVPKTLNKLAEHFYKIGSIETRRALQAAYSRGRLIGGGRGPDFVGPGGAGPEFVGPMQRLTTQDWYMMGQLEQDLVRQMGPKAGRAAFKEKFATSMAATTGGMKPRDNLIAGGYQNYLAAKGERWPEQTHQWPSPVGSQYGSQLAITAQRIQDEGGFKSLGVGGQNPKRHNFAGDFMGHRKPGTMDEQMSDLMQPGKTQPDWYGLNEHVMGQEAEKAGADPRMFQETGWAGHKNAAGGPMIREVNHTIERIHRLTGMPRSEIVVRAWGKGNIPVYGVAGLAALKAFESQISGEE